MGPIPHQMITTPQLRNPPLMLSISSSSQSDLIANNHSIDKAVNATMFSKTEALHIPLQPLNTTNGDAMQCSSLEHNEHLYPEHGHYHHNPSSSLSHASILDESLSSKPINPSPLLVGGNSSHNSAARPALLSSYSHGVPQPGTPKLWSKCVDDHSHVNSPPILSDGPQPITHHRDYH